MVFIRRAERATPRWDALGCAVDEDALAHFREEPGTLADKRWLQLTWLMPEKENAPCWWLITPGEEDLTKPPTILSRSLLGLRLELNQTRMATSQKLRHTYEARAEANAAAVDVLHHNEHLWHGCSKT